MPVIIEDFQNCSNFLPSNCGEFWAGATFRPRGMKTTRPNSAARAKELGENKGVADNGLTNTNEIIPTIR
jgi:hypothetical protein